MIYYNNDKNSTESDISVEFNDSIIHNDKHANHLGNIIGIKSTDTHIDECINDFYKRVNVLIAMFSKSTLHVKYKLFKTFCMHLYGCQLMDLSSKHMCKFYTA